MALPAATMAGGQETPGAIRRQRVAILATEDGLAIQGVTKRHRDQPQPLPQQQPLSTTHGFRTTRTLVAVAAVRVSTYAL